MTRPDHCRCNPLPFMGCLAALLLLAGCASLGGPDHPLPKHYTLNAPVAHTAHNTADLHTSLVLNLRPLTAPDWLNSKRMLYRLDYTSDSRISAYTRSAWADTPARMVGNNLDRALASTRLFKAVLANGAGQADLALQIDLSDFSQHFSSQKASHTRLAAQATLLRRANGQVIAQRRFTVTAPASQANAASGVKAFGTADAAFNKRITRWLTQTIRACEPNCA